MATPCARHGSPNGRSAPVARYIRRRLMVPASHIGHSVDTVTSPPLPLRPPGNRVDPRCRRWWTAQVAVLMPLPLIVLLVVSLFLGPWMLLAAAAWLLITAA